MRQPKVCWYRQLAAPGVEYTFRVAKGAPKRFEMVVRSVTGHNLERVYELSDINAAVTHLLVSAGMEFAREIQDKVLRERKQRLDAIAAREAEDERRAVSERAVPEPERAAEGVAQQNDQVPANHDAGAAKASAQDSGPSVSGRGKGRRGQPKAGRDDSATVSQAGS